MIEKHVIKERDELREKLRAAEASAAEMREEIAALKRQALNRRITLHGELDRVESAVNGDYASYQTQIATLTKERDSIQNELNAHTESGIVFGNTGLACTKEVADAYSAVIQERDEAVARLNEILSGHGEGIVNVFRRFTEEIVSLTKERDIAESILLEKGYTLCPGPARWKPPLGTSPEPYLDKIDALTQELDDAKEKLDYVHRMGLRFGMMTTSDKPVPFLAHTWTEECDQTRIFNEWSASIGWQDRVAKLEKERDEAVAFIAKAGKLMEECYNGTHREAILSACTDVPKVVEFLDRDPLSIPGKLLSKVVANAIGTRDEMLEKLRAQALAEIARKDEALKNLPLEAAGMIVRYVAKHRPGILLNEYSIRDVIVEALAALSPDAQKGCDGSRAANSGSTSGSSESNSGSFEAAPDAQEDPKQYRDLIPDVDRWQEGDEKLFNGKWVSCSPSGQIVETNHCKGRRPLPESAPAPAIPEGWAERRGDGIWIVPEGAMCFSEHKNQWFNSSNVGFESEPDARYLIQSPSVAKESSCSESLNNSDAKITFDDFIGWVKSNPDHILVSGLFNDWRSLNGSEIHTESPWIDQPTELGWWWYRSGEKCTPTIVRIGEFKSGWSKYLVAAEGGFPIINFRGQFQGPLKPRESRIEKEMALIRSIATPDQLERYAREGKEGK